CSRMRLKTCTSGYVSHFASCESSFQLSTLHQWERLKPTLLFSTLLCVSNTFSLEVSNSAASFLLLPLQSQSVHPLMRLSPKLSQKRKKPVPWVGVAFLKAW
uniref:Uncharacterized protein n=1 Tax=Scleropages formosus TaxID=113540 RepID=A0A8C9WF10_SCLFO